MQDRLIGYLLGALSDEQTVELERELARNPTLREEFAAGRGEFTAPQDRPR